MNMRLNKVSNDIEMTDFSKAAQVQTAGPTDPIDGMQKGSFLRRVNSAAWTGFSSATGFMNRLVNPLFNSMVNLSKHSETQYLDAAFDPTFDANNTVPAVRALKKKDPLTQSSIVAFCNELALQFPNAYLVQSYLHGTLQVSQPPAVPAAYGQLMIPVFLEGGHPIAIFVNRDTNTIQVFDPNGYTVMDHEAWGTRLLANGNKGLFQLVKQLQQAYGDGNTKIEENNKKFPGTFNDRGVFVCKFFESCLTGAPFQPSADIEGMRLQMITTILRADVKTPNTGLSSTHTTSYPF
jgi:hypothetical protein